MAACDNLYGNAEQWLELYYFLKWTKPEYILRYMKDKPIDDEPERICYIASIQGWLVKKCPIDWVQAELGDKFWVQRAFLGKAHHERKLSDPLV